jgi:MFS family permease
LSDNPYQSAAEAVVSPRQDAGLDRESLPRLIADSSFWGLTVTQFLGAFNDNLVKQTLLLLFVAIPASNPDADPLDLQGLGTLVFSVPFILFSGFAGYLSDRFSKRRMIVLCKVAEIAITSLGVGVFALYSLHGMSLLLVTLFSIILFLMGSHSAFFGPGKYGILPEMLREKDLPTANGLVLMTTFLAIIFGSALAGQLMDLLGGRLWISGLVGVGIAILGTCTALLVRRVPAARPKLEFHAGAIGVPRDVAALLRKDGALLAAILASSVFWLSAAMVQMAVNALGKLQLDVGNARTSLMVSCISIGIAAGSVIAGMASRGRFNTRVLWIGLWGMIVCLALVAIPGPAAWHSHLLGYWGSLITLIIMGGFTGMFAVPLQVFVQSRAPADSKGRVIATQNLFQWVGITASAGLYFGVGKLLETIAWPPCMMFAFVAILMLGVAAVYRPRDESQVSDLKSQI